MLNGSMLMVLARELLPAEPSHMLCPRPGTPFGRFLLASQVAVKTGLPQGSLPVLLPRHLYHFPTEICYKLSKL